jgi:hypothetical protein
MIKIIWGVLSSASSGANSVIFVVFIAFKTMNEIFNDFYINYNEIINCLITDSEYSVKKINT